MKIVHTIKDLQAELAVLRAQGKKVGLVPTMGALHAGHASLVKRSVSENGVTVVSVFVNPTQFNDKNDLEKYPRTLDADCRLLEECGADFAFSPSVSEMYPEPDTRQFSYAPLDTVMEGAFRPGHFNGVCQIVSKLFDAVQPDRAYFGEKDFQQLAIIREMVRQLKYNLEIVGCSIVREEDGLALSSRNKRLSAEERENALNISRTLFKSRNFAATHTVSETQKMVEDAKNKVNELKAIATNYSNKAGMQKGIVDTLYESIVENFRNLKEIFKEVLEERAINTVSDIKAWSDEKLVKVEEAISKNNGYYEIAKNNVQVKEQIEKQIPETEEQINNNNNK